jgi:hypothetical protein
VKEEGSKIQQIPSMGPGYKTNLNESQEEVAASPKDPTLRGHLL